MNQLLNRKNKLRISLLSTFTFALTFFLKKINLYPLYTSNTKICACLSFLWYYTLKLKFLLNQEIFFFTWFHVWLWFSLTQKATAMLDTGVLIYNIYLSTLFLTNEKAYTLQVVSMLNNFALWGPCCLNYYFIACNTFFFPLSSVGRPLWWGAKKEAIAKWQW